MDTYDTRVLLHYNQIMYMLEIVPIRKCFRDEMISKTVFCIQFVYDIMSLL